MLPRLMAASAQQHRPHHTWYMTLGLRGTLNSLLSKQHLLGGCQQQQHIRALQLGQVLHGPHRQQIACPRKHREFPMPSYPRGWETVGRGLILSPELCREPFPSHLCLLFRCVNSAAAA